VTIRFWEELENGRDVDLMILFEDIPNCPISTKFSNRTDLMDDKVACYYSSYCHIFGIRRRTLFPL
jgi:hypothetical protein